MAARLSCCVTLLLKRDFHKAGVLQNFWEPHRKGKYEQKVKVAPVEALRYGIKEIPKEIKKFKEEIVAGIKCDHLYGIEHNDYEVLWRFDSPESLEPWIVSCDSDYNEGKSTAEFILNKNKKGLFCGNLNTEVPKDGILKNSGFCNITSPVNEISFKRNKPYDFSNFTHILIKARGDGRAYHMTVNMNREWDLQWNDQYQYILFTRGGPYWQVSKIPFSKFYMGAKGRVQDKQRAIQLDRIRTFGITIADSNPGPFKLELDFIGLINDNSHKSTFEYEMYEVGPYSMT